MGDTSEEVEERAPSSDALVEEAKQTPGSERVEVAFQRFIDELIADVMLNG